MPPPLSHKWILQRTRTPLATSQSVMAGAARDLADMGVLPFPALTDRTAAGTMLGALVDSDSVHCPQGQDTSMDQSSSLLLNIDGLVVDRVVRDGTGRRVVHCSTDPQLAGWCPACGEQSTAPKAWVITRPRDVVIGEDRPILLWRKRKWVARWAGASGMCSPSACPSRFPPGPGSPPGPVAGRRRRSATTPGRCRPWRPSWASAGMTAR